MNVDKIFNNLPIISSEIYWFLLLHSSFYELYKESNMQYIPWAHFDGFALLQDNN